MTAQSHIEGYRGDGGNAKIMGGSLSASGLDGLWLDDFAEKTLARGLTSGEVTAGCAPTFYGGNTGWGVSGSAWADKYNIEVFGTDNGSGLNSLPDNGGSKRVVASNWT